MKENYRKEIISKTKRLVVKVGTGVITTKDGLLDMTQVASISRQAVGLRRRGYEVAVVSSGAVGAGMGELGMRKRPTTLPEIQAAAAVGQSKLIGAYDDCFKMEGYHAAQILLTREDLEGRHRYLNTCNTISALFGLKVIPVINENDTVSVEEISFSDNDALSVLVANLLRAELLVMLSSVDGLYRRPDKGVELIPLVEEITADIEGLASRSKTHLGMGGMESKLRAARIATNSGGAVVIANGRAPDVLIKIMEGEELGTLFIPVREKLTSRKRWIGFTLRPKGKIYVDDGAYDALSKRGKSLLASGIADVDGDFERGDVVSVFATGNNTEFARGLTNYSSAELMKIQGQSSTSIKRILGSKPYDEVVHRDNMVLI
ncbi:MAG: glutamate 5-kinase [Planctomycetes bacterium RIFCSPHIGHO2_02_FULL_50_42]|nr:MAG: glutamate 5-kinase [Planctomycetes bacterium GWA2_50_13]OHB89265.1 MAG: glutamate 5-kinase [Planctomycetes bacterium RIFCSPHIGHO2_02_FULL_50_42]OHB95564.1 MAG: glutamate 5-kinase [Planctomycetes bacterium RIFCSPLOWO2_02_FULL_50_16]OHC03742.1 MAG: glutamate 5-kinase [Planctomycetes bacterium RIFCSPLOWO2_12_FULL_50_35]